MRLRIAETCSNARINQKVKKMKTQQKIEKKGYKVTANMGYKNGEQCIISYTATKGLHKVTQPNITQLYNSLYKK